MFEFLPYFTKDGSVGLYSKIEEDIYHSSYGALSEAYLKFILPADFETFFKNNTQIKILDICFGIGYNSKSFLNYFLQKILPQKNLQKKIINQKLPTCIGAIDTDNISQEKNKILIHAVEHEKNLMKISPFIKTKKNIFNSNKNVDSKIKKILKAQNKKISKTKFEILPEVNFIFIIKLLEQYKDNFLDKNLIEILTDKTNLQFLDKSMLNFAKFYQNLVYKTSSELIQSAYLHNIYYQYISKRYKNALKILKNQEIDISFFENDAREFVSTTQNEYDVVFLDAFTPAKTPNLWTYDFFNKLYSVLNPNGIILTYSNSAAIRNAFLQNGFYVGKIFNEVENKFTGTVASKNSDLIKCKLTDYDLGLINSKAGILYRDKNLNLSNDEILKNRKIETTRSNLISATQFIKQNKE